MNHRARRVEESKRELTSFNSRILSLYAFHFAKRNTLFVLWFKVLVAVSLFHFGSLPAHAQANCSTDTSFTYYVRTSGSDSNTGRSYTAAFRTVQKAATVATAGQSVCIAAGCYRERVTLPNSGASDTNRITFVGEAPVVPCFDESTCTILDPSEELTGGWVLATEITGHNNKIWKKTDTAAGVFYAYAVLAGPGGKKYPIFSLSVPGTCVGGTNPGAECNGSGYPSCQGGGTCQGSHTSAYGADYSDWRTALSTGPLLTPVGGAFNAPHIRSWHGVPALFADPETSGLDTTVFFRMSQAASPTYSDGAGPDNADVDWIRMDAALIVDGRHWITIKNITIPWAYHGIRQVNATGLRLDRLTMGPARNALYLNGGSNVKVLNSYFTHGWWPNDGLSASQSIEFHGGMPYAWRAYFLGKQHSASNGGSNPSAGMFLFMTDMEFANNTAVDLLSGFNFSTGTGGNYSPNTASTNCEIHHNVVERNNSSAFFLADRHINLRVHDNYVKFVDQCYRHYIGGGPAYFYRNRCLTNRSSIGSGLGPDYDRMIYAPPYNGIATTPLIFWYHNSVSARICMRVANTYSGTTPWRCAASPTIQCPSWSSGSSAECTALGSYCAPPAADASGVRWFNNLFSCGDLYEDNGWGPWLSRTKVQHSWMNTPQDGWMGPNNVHGGGVEAWPPCVSEPCAEPSWQPPQNARGIGVDVTIANATLGIPSGGLPGFSSGYFDGTAPDAGAVQYGGDTAAPVISNVRVYNIAATSASIAWDLSEPGTGQIEYGATTSYGSFSALEPSFNYSVHLQTLTGLSANTLYHYRIRSADALGNLAISGDYTFQTSGGSAVPSPPTGLRIVP